MAHLAEGLGLDLADALAVELQSGARYDAFAKALIGGRIGVHESIAKGIAGIGDADVRLELLRKLKEVWEDMDADAAAEWEKGLSEEERERLREMEGE